MAWSSLQLRFRGAPDVRIDCSRSAGANTVNLFSGQRDAAVDAAHQAEALAKLNPKRLVRWFSLPWPSKMPLKPIVLPTGNPGRAGFGGCAYAWARRRHIALRLDDAKRIRACAGAGFPKLLAARGALRRFEALRRKFEEALALYRELLQTDPKNNSARVRAWFCSA